MIITTQCWSETSCPPFECGVCISILTENFSHSTEVQKSCDRSFSWVCFSIVLHCITVCFIALKIAQVWQLRQSQFSIVLVKTTKKYRQINIKNISSFFIRINWVVLLQRTKRNRSTEFDLVNVSNTHFWCPKAAASMCSAVWASGTASVNKGARSSSSHAEMREGILNSQKKSTTTRSSQAVWWNRQSEDTKN